MRLTLKERQAIRSSAIEAFGPAAIVRVFGSRLDDQKRGGDIDLHVALPDAPAISARSCFRRLLDQHVGERDYDILITVGEAPASPVALRALAEGVVL